MQRLEHNIDPDALVSELRIGQQQIVEIAKALAQDVRVLIMDEPTSALSASEVEVLFKVIRDLKAHGVSIIYISHKLEEITQIGDYVTVLRDGRLVAEERIPAIDVPWIIEKMVGKNPASLFHKELRTLGEEILRVEEMTLPRLGGGFAVDHVSLALRKGEVVGIYGLMGAGRSELLKVWPACARRPAGGSIWVASNCGQVALLTASRRASCWCRKTGNVDGLVQTLSVANNMLLASLKNYLNCFFLPHARKQNAVTEMIKTFRSRLPTPNRSSRR